MPKTIDNDVYPIKLSLGAWTAAEQGARFFANVVGEQSANPRMLIVHEVMGRNCGWLTAFTAIAYRKMENGVISVGLKIDRTTPDGHYMDEETFNYPLTVRVRVPSGWNTASYEFAGKTVEATCYTADGQRYVNVNIVPGDDGAVSSVALTRVD